MPLSYKPKMFKPNVETELHTKLRWKEKLQKIVNFVVKKHLAFYFYRYDDLQHVQSVIIKRNKLTKYYLVYKGIHHKIFQMRISLPLTNKVNLKV